MRVDCDRGDDRRARDLPSVASVAEYHGLLVGDASTIYAARGLLLELLRRDNDGADIYMGDTWEI